MTVVNLSTLATALGLPGTRPISATVVATPWRGDGPAARVDGAEVIIPDGVTSQVVGNVATPPLDLAPNDGTWCWRISIVASSPRFRLLRYVTVPSAPSVAFGDLVEVDADTFLPSAEAISAWEAAVATVRDGYSAYELAVQGGFVGTEAEWLASLEGDPGPEGASAYEVAVFEGFVGDEAAWLASLRGEDGQDGADSTVPGPPGPSAYEVAIANGFVGTEAEWLASLEGADGEDGADSTVPGPAGPSAYEVAVSEGFVGTEAEWLASLTGPAGAGLKQYASIAEVDAVTSAEQGIYRFAAGTMDDFFGAAGSSFQYYVAEVLFSSYLSDNYSGAGYPPAVNGRIQQLAEVTDGYGDRKLLTRTRSYTAGTGLWGSWGAWVLAPIPIFRPAADGLWRVGSAVNGSGDGTVPLAAPTAPANAAEGQNTFRYIAESWSVWFQDASRSALEGGELRLRSAGFDFDGILDGARTDVGTVAFAAREASLTGQSNRIEAVAAAAAANAVAGFSIPIGIVNRYGLLFHATFAMRSGMTPATRLLCGLVDSSKVALAMSDVEPAAAEGFLGAGYGSADANVRALQRVTGSMSSGDSGAPVSTAADQLIDYKAFITPNMTSLVYILSVRTGGTITRVTSTQSQVLGNALPYSFFIRASAGGTEAQPRVALHRLRVGAGLGSVGGF
jgi:hypothetical protein